jgi:hypothetical protein
MAEWLEVLKETVGRFTGIGRLIPIGQLCRIGRFPNQQVEGSIPSWRALESCGKTVGSLPSDLGPNPDSATDLRNAAVNSVQLRPTRTNSGRRCRA